MFHTTNNFIIKSKKIKKYIIIIGIHGTVAPLFLGCASHSWTSLLLITPNIYFW